MSMPMGAAGTMSGSATAMSPKRAFRLQLHDPGAMTRLRWSQGDALLERAPVRAAMFRPPAMFPHAR